MPASAAQAGEAVTIEPAIRFVDVTRGARQTLQLTVKNQTTSDYDFSAAAGDVAPRTNGVGSQPVIPDAPGSRPRGAGSWLKISPATWSLRAGTERVLRIDVQVPQDARAGGSYATISILIDSPTQGDGAVPVQQEPTAAMLFTVQGEYRRAMDVQLTPLDTFRWTGGATSWEVELRNDGDVHENVSGSVEIDGMLAGASKVGIDSGVLLPGESRRQRVELDVRSAPDVLRATASIQRDGADATTKTSARTYVLPWWIIVVGMLLVGGVTWRLRARSFEEYDE